MGRMLEEWVVACLYPSSSTTTSYRNTINNSNRTPIICCPPVPSPHTRNPTKASFPPSVARQWNQITPRSLPTMRGRSYRTFITGQRPPYPFHLQLAQKSPGIYRPHASRLRTRIILFPFWLPCTIPNQQQRSLYNPLLPSRKKSQRARSLTKATSWLYNSKP